MGKLLLISMCCLGLLGCSSTPDEEMLTQKQISPLQYAPIPLELEVETTRDLRIDPILQDSIITLAEQELLIEALETLLQELSYYKRLYYLQLLKK